MDLWLRSQDRHQLIKVDSIGLTYDDGKASRIVCYENSRTWVVARYRTQERAMEVLDEIQNYLTPRFIVNSQGDTDSLENLFDKVTEYKAFPDNKLEIKNISRDSWVYEMPKE